MYFCFMSLFFLLAGLFFFSRYVIIKIFTLPFNYKNDDEITDNSTTIIHNHYTQNHLHVDEKFLNNNNKQNGKT